jgi:sarcosine oxidase subunit gamma
MAEAQFAMSVGPCVILQAEGWPPSLPAFEAELSRQLGVALPAAVGRTASIGSGMAVRIAPRRLWLVSDGPQLPDCAIDPDLGCLLPLGEGRVRVRLEGPRIFDVLAACVAVDWHETGPGRAVQAGFHHVPVLLLRTAADACDLLVPRSFARSLAEWIDEIARQYEPHTAAVTA